MVILPKLAHFARTYPEIVLEITHSPMMILSISSQENTTPAFNGWVNSFSATWSPFG